MYKERLSLQSEVNILTTDHAVDLLLRSRSSHYEQGDKAGKLLAHWLQQTASSHQIPQIQTPSGTTTDLKGINDEFKEYYTTSYISELAANTQKFDHFFASLEITLVHLVPLTHLCKEESVPDQMDTQLNFIDNSNINY